MRQFFLLGILTGIILLSWGYSNGVSHSSTLYNAPPVALSDTSSTIQATADTIDVLANDMDPEGGPLNTRYVETLGPINGSASVLDENWIIYIPNDGFIGIDSFQYLSCDASSECSAAWIIVDVLQANQPPVIDDEALSRMQTDEDDLLHIPVIENTTDPEGDQLHIAILEHTQFGPVTINADTITYIPVANYYGQDTLRYIVCDMEPLCDTITTYIEVLPINDPPVSKDDYKHTEENEATEINTYRNDKDIDNITDELSIRINVAPKLGNIAVNGLKITYKPFKLVDGLDSLQYILCDLEPLCDTAWVYITIEDICDDCENMSEDDSTYIVTYNKQNTSAHNFDNLSITKYPSYGNIKVTEDTILYIPNLNYNGRDRLTYIVCDTEPSCDTVRMCIYVNPVNDPPVAQNDTIYLSEDIQEKIFPQANDNDVDGDQLRITILAPPHIGYAPPESVESIIYTPYYNLNGLDSIQYMVCDQEPLCDTAWIHITVAPTEEEIHSIDEDSVGYVILPLTQSYEDIDDTSGYQSTVSVQAPPTSDGVITTDGDTSLIYTPPHNWFGEDTILIEVCYEWGHCLSDSLFITVNSVDDPVVAVNDTVSLSENHTMQLDAFLNDSNPDGGTISMTIMHGPTNGTITLDSTIVEYIPTPEFIGTDSLMYEVCNSYGICDSATIHLKVNFLNQEPTITFESIIEITDTSLIYLDPVATATDPNEDSLYIIILSEDTASVSITPDGTISYRPSVDFLLKDTLYYAVCDTHAIQLCDTAMIILNMACPSFNHSLVHDANCPNEEFNVTGAEERDLTEYEWSFSDESDLISTLPTITNLKIDNPQRLVLKSKRYGCTAQYDSINIVVRDSIESPNLEEIEQQCALTEVSLNVNNPDSNLTYQWYYADKDTSVGLGSELKIAELNDNTAGAYFVIASDEHCSSKQSNNINLEIITDFTPPTINAGADQYICEAETSLNALPSPSRTGSWSSTGNANIDDITSPNTKISNPQVGENIFIWTQQNRSCIAPSIDSVSIFHYPQPEPLSDSFFVLLKQDYIFDLKPNDIYHNLNTSISIINTPADVSDHGDGNITVNIDGSYESPLLFEYQVCFEECADNCKTAQVNIHFDEPARCIVPDVITPNGDGFNDYLVVDCNNQYPQSTMTIFNRWGDEVYKNENYDNSWDGMNDGKPLAQGTYFYIFKISDIDESSESGFIQIER